MAPLHQMKETNALAMNKKIMSILADRDSAIRERNMAMADAKEALSARDEALRQREEALIQRDKALMERDNARAALQFWENSCSYPMVDGSYRGAKRLHRTPYSRADITDALAVAGVNVTDAFPISSISAEDVKPRMGKRAKESSRSAKAAGTPRKGKKVGEDLNIVVPNNEGKKTRNGWDGVEVGFNMVELNGSSMPVPVCSCTGTPRHCYKWGKGGWQSSCCTTNISEYPLPQVQNKRHGRMSGRKMSGGAFTKLVSRLVGEGYDLSVPLDLKKYWAKHGTNRYITIK
ncbi:hypothetical protein MLD38_013878 [Melastoma candidum]|uniref:Uncharacterized protein n=1 Tax=Melastoma candidum TaxID=119954 RepID=A0ACB9REN1_9MYRT|nr:hypothetical protein MLD38_013878 [Melastoma candidum]